MLKVQSRVTMPTLQPQLLILLLLWDNLLLLPLCHRHRQLTHQKRQRQVQSRVMVPKLRLQLLILLLP